MTPHAGKLLQLRVVDKMNHKEVNRITVPSITSDFTVSLDGILQGHDYYVDFYADHNGNGFYDAPPTDHTWRLELNDAQGSDVLNFAHNTDFTDINWPYLLTVEFSGMTPHVGRLLELRVVDDATSMEVGRTRIESISSADFNVTIPGLELGKEYKVEFYADHNGNGIYDAPPVDHTWEIMVNSSEGDVTAGFAHNTDFKDLSWKYLYTLNLSGMTPHLGKLFELRVYHSDHSEEVGRMYLDAIPAC